MTRPLTQYSLTEMYRQESAEGWILLCTLSHPDLAAPIRVANDFRPAGPDGARVVISRGMTFVCYPFAVELPTDDGESVPSASLAIDNVDRSILALFRSVQGPFHVLLEVVPLSVPDVVEASHALQMADIEYDASTLKGNLSMDNLMAAYPGQSYTPNLFPGLF
ncbi:MAG: DUF1833 domain-containing protein [Magnetococcus sp. MYC-9]